MAYNITLTNGQNLVTIPDGTADSSYTSLTLFGKNFAGYGPLQNENFVKHLENFSFVTPPANPLQGQLWWDSSNKHLKIRNESTWKVVSGPTASATAPITPVVGDQWWDTNDRQLKIWQGSAWTIIGPAYSDIQGTSGPVVATVAGTDNLQRLVVFYYVANTLVAVMSKEPTFTVTSIPGFTTISPGVNLPVGMNYYGDSENALKLGGVLAANYLRGDVASTAIAPLTIEHNAGITVGASNNLSVYYSTNGNESRIENNVAGQSLSLRINKAGVDTQVMRIDGTTGLATVYADPSEDAGIATKRYVDTKNNAQDAAMLKADGSNPITGDLITNTDGQNSIGSASAKMGTIFSTSFTGTTVNTQTATFGSAIVNSTPTQAGHVTTKSYVDTAINSATDTATAYTDNKVLDLRGAAPVGLDTLYEIAQALNNDPAFANNVIAALDARAPKASPAFTGTPTAPVATTGDNSSQIAVTAFVKTATDAVKAYTDNKIENLSSTPVDGLVVTGHITTPTTGTLDIGSSANKFRTLYSTSTSAIYADLAENYVADAQYEPGTVLDFGGEFEVTLSVRDGMAPGTRVAGVVSTDPAYLMNSNCEGKYVVALALQGRCPVKVYGPIRKGDVLIAGNNGFAVVDNEPMPCTVIGKALEDFDGYEGIVEASISKA
jgi:hypothetical protein